MNKAEDIMRICENLIWIVLTVSLVAAGCSDIREIETERIPVVDQAVCLLTPTGGSPVSGVVTFTETEEGVLVTARVKGLTPGRHGFHIHQYGDLRSPHTVSAGGHYNPGENRHGAPSDAERHAGDLGNLAAGSDSTAVYRRTDTVISLDGADSIIGRAVIVHAGEDDLVSQPAGNTGPGVARGVIGIANPDYRE
jgi:Cu-Zn family superoxide dismutase